MTHLSLENYGVSNLETREMKITNGGAFWQPLAIVLIGVAVAEIISDWEHFKQGLKDAIN